MMLPIHLTVFSICHLLVSGAGLIHVIYLFVNQEALHICIFKFDLKIIT